MKRLLALLALCALVTACQKDGSAAAPKAADSPVTIQNFKQGERLIYPVPLMRGLCRQGITEVKVTNKTNGRETVCPAFNGKFKGWTRLEFGTNEVVVSDGKTEDTLRLFYERANTDYLYYPYYMVPAEGDFKYLSNLGDKDPQEQDPQLWLKKMRTSLELLQSYTADCMVREGYDRKTFSFDLTPEGEVNVQVVTCKYTKAEVNSWSRPNGDFEEGKLYESFLDAVGRDRMGGGYIRITGLPNTQILRKEDGRLYGNTALGGVGLAQFGANGLYGWPSSLDDIVQCFTNNTPITTANNDSIGRDVQWGHAATTFGAYQHEIGHSLYLPHIEGPGIMARAGDHINRIFTFFETPTASCPTNYYFTEAQEYRWNKPELHWLNCVPHMNEVKGPVSYEAPVISVEPDRETISITSVNGLIMYDISDPTFVLSYDNMVYYNPPYEVKEVKIKISEALAKIGKDMVQIDAVDAYGNSAEATFMKLVEEAPSRSYDFSDFQPGPVDGQQGLRPLDGDSVGDIVEDPEEGLVLRSKTGGKGIMAPVAVVPADPKARTLEYKVRLKPSLGTLYFDAKDVGGESLFYAYVDEEGRLEINADGAKPRYIKTKIEPKWQDWTFVLDIKKQLLTRVIIDGKAFVLSDCKLGGNGGCECFWLKDTGYLGSYFKRVSATFQEK